MERNASKEIERAIDTFEKNIRVQRTKYAPRLIYPSLTPMQPGLVNKLHKDDIHKVVCEDKNDKSAVIETVYFTEKGVKEHLSNHAVYTRLTEGEANDHLEGVELPVQSFASR